MITSSTMPTFTTTATMFTCDDTLMPRHTTPVRISTMAAATRLWPSPYNDSGRGTPPAPHTAGEAPTSAAPPPGARAAAGRHHVAALPVHRLGDGHPDRAHHVGEVRRPADRHRARAQG